MAALTVEKMRNMVKNSRRADKRSMRTYEAGTFITIPAIERLILDQEDKCLYCSGPFDHNAPDHTWPDAPSLERLDESLAHTIDNCVLVCRYCNASRQRKTVEEMKKYAACLKLGWVKYCPTCMTYYEDSEDAFGKDRSRPDGLQSFCRHCRSPC